MKLKKVISNALLKEKMLEALKILCDTVKTTLGPKGSNIIIDHSDFSPFITNDGVTIAENITSEDPIINTILELAKEASIKTNETVGDGTTTTLVLLESLYEEGIKLINEVASPLIIKKELDLAKDNILSLLSKEKLKLNSKTLENIASVASNDKEIGKTLTEAYKKVKDNIYLMESDNEKTTVTYQNGYVFDTILASSYFMKNAPTLTIDNAKILITTQIINFSEEISSILNYLISNPEPLIIIAKDYSDDFVNEILSAYLDSKLNVILLKTPGYGFEEQNIIEDIAHISKTKVNHNLNDTLSLGFINHLKINNETTEISFELNDDIKTYLENIKNTNTELNNKRIAMLTTGYAEIKIGAPTTTERREKKMRYEDALWALKSTCDGILPGGGLTLYKISSLLDANNIGNKILKIAFQKPLEQILTNAALDKNQIIKQIKDNDFKVLYNVATNKYEDISSSDVVDAYLVVESTIINAISIAGMLLTTTSLIINEFPKTITKDDFGEI